MKPATRVSLALVALFVGLLVIVAQTTEAQSRRAARARPTADQDDGALDEPQPAPTRRRQASRRTASDEDDEGSSSLAASSGDDQADGQDYSPPARASSRNGGRRRVSYDQDEERPARRRSSRRNNRRNNNNNVNFNGLPDGFPSAAFGAGFGAAVSGGGRGRGPSNAAGFGAGFAQSGGGNALAGGFGSGLVNGGYGGSKYDDDEDSDYDSGRVKSKPTTKCMMLQLLQSPSTAVQRLIERDCKNKAEDGENLGDEDNQPEISKEQSPSTSSRLNKNDLKTSRKQQVSYDDKSTKTSLIDDQDIDKSGDQILSTYSESSNGQEPGGGVQRTNQKIDKGNGILVTSSSYSSSRANDWDNETSDSDDGNDNDDYVQ